MIATYSRTAIGGQKWVCDTSIGPGWGGGTTSNDPCIWGDDPPYGEDYYEVYSYDPCPEPVIPDRPNHYHAWQREPKRAKYRRPGGKANICWRRGQAWGR